MPAAASPVAGPSSQPAKPRGRKPSGKRSHKRKPRASARDDSPDEILPSTMSLGKGSKSKSHRPRRGEGDEAARREREKVLRTQDGGDAQSRRVRRRLEELERGTISGPGLDASSIALPADSTYAGAWAGLLAGRAAESEEADDLDLPEASTLRAPSPEEPEPEPEPEPVAAAPPIPLEMPKMPTKIPHRKGAAEAARRAHAEAVAALERAQRGEVEQPKPVLKRKRPSEPAGGAVRRKQDPELVKLMSEKKSFEVRREEAAQHPISLSAMATYETAAAAPSRYPATRALPLPCSVCGYFAQAKCVRCEEKVCSVACTATHDETRCERPR